MKTSLFLAALVFTQIGSADIDTTKLPSYATGSVKTVAFVDLNRYSGLWYEVAAIPQIYQKQCIRNTTAEYKLSGIDLSITNSCEVLGGERIVSEGRARVVNKKSQAKLEIMFMIMNGWKFNSRGNYWILAVGENYSYAVVGTPDRGSAWILSRTPELRKDYFLEAHNVLIKQGFNTCRLITSVQTLGLQQNKSLCSQFE